MFFMKSRMDKYFDTTETKARTTKNQQLYRTIYDEAEYSNVEGISVIEKNEKIDLDMIKDLINKNNTLTRVKEEPEPLIIDNEDAEDAIEKNYDIRDVLNKAKDNRTPDSRMMDTQYNILKNINLNENINDIEDVKEEELKDMIEAISNNSKGYTTNLLDDLKSIYDPTMHDKIAQKIEETQPMQNTIDTSFYTSSMGFKKEDFESSKQADDDVEQNSTLTKILIAILCSIIAFGIIFLVFHFV